MHKKKKKKIRIVIGVLLVGILGICMLAIAFYVYKSRKDVRTYQRAIQAYQDRDYEEARLLFTDLLYRDKNNEGAVVKLAEIAESEGNWNNALYYRGRARALNELEPSHAEKYLHAARMGRFFNVLDSYYATLKSRRLSLAEQTEWLYCRRMKHEDAKAAVDWEALLQEHPEAADTPHGKLIKIAFYFNQETFGEFEAIVKELSEGKEPHIAQEALIIQARMERLLNRPQEEEKALKAAQALNNCTATPMLAEFLSYHGDYPAAATALDAHLRTYYNASEVIVVGDFMLLGNLKEPLENLLAFNKRYVDRKSMVATYYLEALLAFHDNDYSKLAQTYPFTKGEIDTPVSNLFFCVLDSSHAVHGRAWQSIHGSTPPPPDSC